MQQHAIFGAGLIGGFLYGALASNGHQVAMVARRNVQQKLAAGLKLTDYQGHHANVKTPRFINSESLADKPEAGSNYAYLWLTVKCTAVESAAKELAHLINKDTLILCCQNGLGSDGIIKRAFPNNPVVRAMVPFNVAEITPGHLHRGSEGYVCIESNAPTISALVSAVNCPLMPVHGSSNMQAILWAKLQLNLANAVNALADIPVKSMLEQRDYRRCIALLMTELLAVAKSKGITLPKLTALPASLIPKLITAPNFIFQLLGNKMLAIDPTVRASMWWDLSQGKPCEIEYLNGAVVDEGRNLGVDCPANQKIVGLIHQVEQGQRSQGMAAKALLQTLQAG